MKTFDQVAVAPIAFDHNQGKSERIVAGLSSTDKSRRNIVSSTVLFDSTKFKIGQTLFFKADISQFTFFNERHHLKSGDSVTEFILVPDNLVVGYRE